MPAVGGGASSDASAAIDRIHTWVDGTAEGAICSYPVTTSGGDYRIVQGLSIDEFSRKRMDASLAELRGVRDGVKDLPG